jgi:hypothetical protein
VSTRDRPASTFERVEALLANPALFELAEHIPARAPGMPGRPSQYPPWMWLLYEALISIYGSARAVDTELSHPTVWQLIRRRARRQLKHQRHLWPPSRPMRRHHYLYARTHHLQHVVDELWVEHRRHAAATALEVGLLDVDGEGSWTHPHGSRAIYADGKVIKPLTKLRPDKSDSPRVEHDAGLHWQGTGEAAWGIKYVLVATRGPNVHQRVILDADHVPKPGGEAATAMDCFRRLQPSLEGCQTLIYDTALRGVHHQQILRDFGWIPVNRLQARQAGPKDARRQESEQRQPKSVHIEDRTITTPTGTKVTLRLFTLDGALGIATFSDAGIPLFEPLTRLRTHRRPGASGWRWYNTYRLPDRLGAGEITVRLHGNTEDTERGLNRTENLRPIPPSDPDFASLYPLRNDAESINRNLDDTHWLRRAHSLGHRRQLLNLLGYALVVNSLTRHRYTQARAPDQQAA